MLTVAALTVLGYPQAELNQHIRGALPGQVVKVVESLGEAAAAKALTLDEARRIAANIAKLSQFLRAKI